MKLEGPLPPETGKKYVVALDVGLRHDRTAVAVCHSEPVLALVEGEEHTRGVRVVLDRMQVFAGRGKADEVQLDEVAAWIDWASSNYNRAEVVFDPSQAILLAQQLRKRGLRMDEYAFHPRSVSALALNLHNLIRSHALVLPHDAELLDELANVRLRETSPGTYRLDHDADRHDDRAVALALAAHRLVEQGTRQSGGGVAGAIRHGQRREARQETLRASTRELAELEKLRTKDLAQQKKLAKAGKRNTLGTCWYCGDGCGASSTLCGACMGNKRRRREMYEQRLTADAAADVPPEQPPTNDRGEPMEEGWLISEYEARRRDPGYLSPRYD